MLFVLTALIKILEMLFWVVLSCVIVTALAFLLFLVHRWAEDENSRH